MVKDKESSSTANSNSAVRGNYAPEPVSEHSRMEEEVCESSYQVMGCLWPCTQAQWESLTGWSGCWSLQRRWYWEALRDKQSITHKNNNIIYVIYIIYDRNQETSETRDRNMQRERIFKLPWTLSRMCCWASPAALVARHVYLPESSSLASVTFRILPADSSCDRDKWKHTQSDTSYKFNLENSNIFPLQSEKLTSRNWQFIANGCIVKFLSCCIAAIQITNQGRRGNKRVSGAFQQHKPARWVSLKQHLLQWYVITYQNIKIN